MRVVIVTESFPPTSTVWLTAPCRPPGTSPPAVTIPSSSPRPPRRALTPTPTPLAPSYGCRPCPCRATRRSGWRCRAAGSPPPWPRTAPNSSIWPARSSSACAAWPPRHGCGSPPSPSTRPTSPVTRVRTWGPVRRPLGGGSAASTVPPTAHSPRPAPRCATLRCTGCRACGSGHAGWTPSASGPTCATGPCGASSPLTES